MRPPLGRIITFYSYKGGTGRSMALANVAWVLASAGRRVLTIDWDLEAPGLHRYFRPFLIDSEIVASEGLMDLVDNYASEAIRPVQDRETPAADWYLSYADFSDYIVSVNFPHFPKGGKIDLLPAGRQSERYALAVSSFNWQNFYDRLGGGGFFEAVKQQARSQYDYILIDSRTGVSDTAGICSVQMPDTLVVCFTYNNQSIKGAAAVARSAHAMHQRLVEEKLALRRAGKTSELPSPPSELSLPYRVFPVPMRVDSGESDRLALRQAFARSSFEDMIEHLGPDRIQEYWKNVEVPHTVFYSYEEVLSPFKDDPRDPKTVLAALLRLTGHVTDSDVSSYELPIAPEKRQEYLDAFAETPLASARKAPTQSQRETEHEALVRSAQVAMSELSEEDRAIARRVLLRMVRIGREEEGSGYFPIRANLSDFSDAEQRVLGHLVDHGVVVTSSSNAQSKDVVVSLCDPRLLTLWSQLIGWIEQDREFLSWRQRLRAYAEDWNGTGRDPGGLLSGRLLSEADVMLLKREADLSTAEIEYISASRNASQIALAPPPAVAMPSSAVDVAGSAPSRAYPSAPPSRALPMRWVAAAVGAAIVILGVFSSMLYRGGVEQSLPSASISLPDFTSYPSKDAKATAEQLGLTVALVAQDGTPPEDALLEGFVVAQQPSPKTSVGRGDLIRLTVSSITVSVPNVVNSKLAEAQEALDRQRLSTLTESRYVPNAPVDVVFSQDPLPSARVAVGTTVKLVVARAAQLVDFRVGIYYPGANDALDKFARRIEDTVEKTGTEIHKARRQDSYFIGAFKAERNEIRYGSDDERRAADELRDLLREAGLGTFSPVQVKSPSEGFISIFLVADNPAESAVRQASPRDKTY